MAACCAIETCRIAIAVLFQCLQQFHDLSFFQIFYVPTPAETQPDCPTSRPSHHYGIRFPIAWRCNNTAIYFDQVRWYFVHLACPAMFGADCFNLPGGEAGCGVCIHASASLFCCTSIVMLNWSPGCMVLRTCTKAACRWPSTSLRVSHPPVLFFW